MSRTLTHWSSYALQILQAQYANTKTQDIANRLGFGLKAVRYKAYALGLKKSPEFIRETGVATSRDPRSIATRFAKGQISWNKGTKGLTGAHPNTRATQFKKGQRSPTWRPIGSERICGGYLQRKVSDTGYPPKDWVSLHILVWQEHTGQPVPSGHAVVFKDNNRQNFAIENLELVSRQELMRRNSYHTTLPPELREVVQLRGQLTRQINRANKALSNPTQEV